MQWEIWELEGIFSNDILSRHNDPVQTISPPPAQSDVDITCLLERSLMGRKKKKKKDNLTKIGTKDGV